MPLSKIVFAALVASFLTSSAYAEGASPTNPPTMGAEGGHGMMHGMLTPEERMMMFADMSKATANMTDDQKHAYRHEQRDRIMAMSEADRFRFKADLDARWNALPADQKADMTAKMQTFRAAREARDGDK
jgi:hypothetical protein